MKRVISALLATVAVAAVAAPAMAQPYGYGGGYRGGVDHGDNQFERRLERFETRLERGVVNGDLTRREAFRIRQDLRDLRVLENRYSRGGFSPRERYDLDQRLDVLQQRIRYERRDGDDRYDRDRYDRRGY